MSVNLGTAYANIKLNTKDFQTALKTAQDQLTVFKTQSELVATGITSVGSSLTNVGRTLTTAVTLPVVGIGTAAVKTTATFDQSMSRVQALSGATGKDFEALRNKAIEMGSSTAYTASEAADALSYMGLAGWNTNQMIEGLPGILNLAASSQMDLAAASDMVTDYLTAFGLEAKDATTMANQMAYAQANSNTSTQELGEAFGNCASQMHTAGQTMETTTAFLEAMANQGLKGSEAGTALSAVMRDITQKMEDGKIAIGGTSVAVMDQNGNFRNLIDIMADVEKATDGMGSAEKSAALMQTFTARSIKAVSMGLTEGTDNLYAYESALNNVDGVAENMADQMLNNLSGQLTILKATLEDLAIQIGDALMPTIKDFVSKVRDIVKSFSQLDESTKRQIIQFALIAASIGPVLLIIGKLVTSVGHMVTAYSTLVSWLTKVSAAFNIAGGAGGAFSSILSGVISAAGPIIAVVAAVAALGVALKAAYDQGGKFKEAVDSLVSSLKSGLGAAIEKLKSGFESFKKLLEPIIETIKNSFDFDSVDSGLAKIVSSIQRIGEYLAPIVSTLFDLAENVLKTTLAPTLVIISGLIDGFMSALGPLISLIGDIASVVADVVGIISGLLIGLVTGDFSQFLNSVSSLGTDLKSLVTDLVDTILSFVTGFFEGVFTALNSFTGGLLTKIADFFVGLWENISEFFTVTIPEAFTTFVTETLPQFIANAKEFFDQLPYNLGYALGEAIRKLIEWGQEAISWIVTNVPIIIGNIVTFFKELPGKIWEWLKNAITKIVNWGTDMKDKATEIGKDFVTNVIDFIKELPGKVWNWIKEIPSKIKEASSDMKTAGSDILNSLWDGMKSVWTNLSSWIEGLKNKVTGFFSGLVDGITGTAKAASGSHAGGLEYVPYNGYRATLHEGERVLTRNEADEYNNGRKSSGGDTFIFNSPKALDAYESNRLFKETIRQMEEGFV